ncbi:uncharacterized protein YndB with AHSA1/START domain [Plantactinospora soyae]|uniref:Uncharacterized protein YndB with AHSA1/START domain n=1 Tax=Plantactinospora soyae TaxID=1544732 RepID=A0A927MCV7_9ACTN|nr:uncharacterized protein YndB with AHSA1/START domain [Plantactinospora soyae]
MWAALTTAEGLGSWFGDSADVDLRPGGEAHVRWVEYGAHTLWIEVVDPPRRFAYSWAVDGLGPSDPRRTHVEFSLEPIGAGTRLTVVETGFAQLPDELVDAFHGNAEGWRDELAELVEYLNAAAAEE